MAGTAATFEAGELVTRLVAAETFKATAEPQLAKLQADLEASQAELATTKETLGVEKAELADQAKELNAKFDKAKTFLVELANKTLPLVGMKVPEGDDVEALTASILEAQDKLKSIIPTGGASQGAISDATKPGSASTGAFSIRK